jgi:hypothetical protein
VEGVALDANQKPVARASVDSIAPGEYKVFAWDEVEDRAWEDTDFIRLYETRGKAVTMREGSTEQVQISSIPSNGPIYGQCSDPFSLFR